jgi:hypothetical protein
MVDVGVRVDEGDHGARAEVLVRELQARAVSSETSGSITIQPVAPSINDITETS